MALNLVDFYFLLTKRSFCFYPESKKKEILLKSLQRSDPGIKTERALADC